MAPRVVFVYGTLRRGERNHRLLSGSVFVGESRTAPGYRLVDMGGFPAMVDGGAVSVEGELYRVDEETLAELDALENHPHFYRRRSISLQDGAEALVYVLPEHHAAGRPRLAGGRWSEEAGKAAPAEAEERTELPGGGVSDADC